MKNYIILLAGGSGKRMGLATPKQYLKLSGRSILHHTLLAVDKSKLFDEIVLVSNIKAAEAAGVNELISLLDTPVKLVAGGKTRNLSSYAGLNSLPDEDANVLIHDAVRPFVSKKVLSRVIESLNTELAVDVAIPTSDTIIRVNSEKYIESIPTRTELFRGQTPQGFKLREIRQAYNQAFHDKSMNFPDDCSVFLEYHKDSKIKVVLGESTNMKITDQFDLSIAEKIFFFQRAEQSIEVSSDSFPSLTDKVIVVFGASSGIGLEIAKLAETLGMKVFGFSRSLTGTNVEDEKSVQHAINQVISTEKRIDFVVNTAGVLLVSPLEKLSQDQISQIININFLGHVNVVRSSLKYLRQSKGSILGFGSSSSMRGRPNYALYSASKAALVNFTQAIAEEESNVRVNLVSPERTKTPMRVNSFGEEEGVNMLSAVEVAKQTLRTLLLDVSGSVFDVKITFDEDYRGASK